MTETFQMLHCQLLVCDIPPPPPSSPPPLTSPTTFSSFTPPPHISSCTTSSIFSSSSLKCHLKTALIQQQHPCTHTSPVPWCLYSTTLFSWYRPICWPHLSPPPGSGLNGGLMPGNGGAPGPGNQMIIRPGHGPGSIRNRSNGGGSTWETSQVTPGITDRDGRSHGIGWRRVGGVRG